jgi:quercetin dioxygenase-like cupin family protein
MAKCRIFAIEDNLKEVVPGGLYMKHLFGKAISVSVVKFVEPRGGDLPSKPHSHGEEATLQIRGGCRVMQGVGSDHDPVFRMDPGDALIIPADSSHYGVNWFGPEGNCLRLNVVTPPRKEFGPEDTVPYYPLKSREDPR